MSISPRQLAATIIVSASVLLLTGSAALSVTPNASSPTSSTVTGSPTTPLSGLPPVTAAGVPASEIVNAFADAGLTITNISDLGHLCAEDNLSCLSAELTDEVMVIQWTDLEQRAELMDPTISVFAGDYSLSLNPEVVPETSLPIYQSIFELAVAGS